MKISLSILCFFLAFNLSAQIAQEETIKSSAVTLGILQGGGSLVGVDFEGQVYKQFALQFGIGLVGTGAGVNIHFSESLRSSFLSIMYWSQGIGSSHAQSLFGPNFVYRGQNWFTAQIGLGFALDKGPAYPANMEQSPVMLMYAIGVYL